MKAPWLSCWIALGAAGCSLSQFRLTRVDIDGGGDATTADGMDVADAADAGIDAGGTDVMPGPIGVPQQLSPLSTTIVTTQNPVFSWQIGSGSDGVQIRVCANRAMTTACRSQLASGGHAAWTVSLPQGTWFWQLTGARGVQLGTAASPVWQIYVGARSAPNMGAWGSLPDFNGDGAPDLAVGAMGVSSTATGDVFVYQGSMNALPAVATVTIAGLDGPGAQFGSTVASVGDLNGDGYGELAVASWRAMNTTGMVHIFAGGPMGLNTATPTNLAGPGGPGGFFGGTITGVGDVNGDGYGDLAVGASELGGGPGAAYLYYGGPNGVRVAPDVTLMPAALGGFGSGIAGTDITGDGINDVLISAPANGVVGATGLVSLYAGGALGLSSEPIGTYPAPESSLSLGPVIGDVNGDGLPDMLLSSPSCCAVGDAGADGTGHVYYYQNTGGSLPSIPTQILPGAGPGSRFGITLASADIDQDGAWDLIGGSEPAAGYAAGGYMQWFAGSAEGISSSRTRTLQNASTGVTGALGYGGAIGDVDHDGRLDYVLGSPILNAAGSAASGARDSTGKVFLYLGSSAGLIGIPQSWTGPGGPQGSFGSGIATL